MDMKEVTDTISELTFINTALGMTINMLLFCTVWSWTPMENSCFYCRFYWY